MAALYLTVFVTLTGAQTVPQSPDELYRHRENLPSAKLAADLWAARAATGDFEAAWKLSRVDYWLGTHGVEADRRAALEHGVSAGQQAATLQPGKPEGHFWAAASMGALAESFGVGQGLKYRGTIKSELELSIKIAPGWQDGSAESALGRWYDSVPGLFGGSDSKAEEWYRKAIAINPQSRNAMSSLADLLIDHKRLDEARTLLKRVIDAPADPEWIPEDRELVTQAIAKLKKLGG
jgi:tetratricopeptide (TPR) repeat protein